MLTAAATDRILGPWGVQGQDPNDYYGQDGPIISNRGQWSFDNDGITHAIVETILAGSIGPTGLQYRSAYQSDDETEVTPEELKVRKSVQRGIRRGTRDFSFDAGGSVSRPGMSKVVLASTITSGIGVSVRCWKPNRPGLHTHAICWRLVNSARISNKNHSPNTTTLRDGFELDADGTPIALHIQRSHPSSSAVAPKQIWDRFPIYDADGYRKVTIHALHRHADQVRPTGWFTPVMQLMRLMSRTIEAKVVADVLKASMGLIVECDDPEAAAAMDANGAVLTGNSKIMPGKCYYVKKDTKWSTLNFSYQGQDFDKWIEVIMTNICASFSLPYQFVQQKLTQSNMASARVALLQAYRTFHGHQNELIISTEDPWNQSLIREDLARGRIDGVDINDPDQVERLLVGRYLRPARFLPDPLKEAQAADVLVKRLGVSLDTAYADIGLDTDHEWTHREQNDAELEKRGIVLQGDGMVMAPAPNQTPAHSDAEDETADDAEDKQPEPQKPDPSEPPAADSMSSADLASAIGGTVATALRSAPALVFNVNIASQRRSVTVKDNADGSVTATTDDLATES